MRSELRRLRTIAKRRNLCPTHMTKLTCGCTRQWRWTGTADEWEEYGRLFDRVLPTVAALYVHGTCGACEIDRYCEACGRERLQKGPIPYTVAEMERMIVLLDRMLPAQPHI